MQEINAIWLYPTIVAAALLQAWGPPMNGALRGAALMVGGIVLISTF